MILHVPCSFVMICVHLKKYHPLPVLWTVCNWERTSSVSLSRDSGSWFFSAPSVHFCFILFCYFVLLFPIAHNLLLPWVTDYVSLSSLHMKQYRNQPLTWCTERPQTLGACLTLPLLSSGISLNYTSSTSQSHAGCYRSHIEYASFFSSLYGQGRNQHLPQPIEMPGTLESHLTPPSLQERPQFCIFFKPHRVFQATGMCLSL